jgi:hypothetical protein
MTTLRRPWGAVRVEALPGLVGYAFLPRDDEEFAGELLPDNARAFANAHELFDEFMPGIMGPDMAAAMLEAADAAEALAVGGQSASDAPDPADVVSASTMEQAVAVLRRALNPGKPTDTGDAA